MGKSMDALMGDIQKTYGDTIGGKGATLPDLPRLPFGLFGVTLQSGGGIPWGRITEIYGAEGSGKTNLCLGLVANAQKLYPDKKVAWVDVENTFDKEWAAKWGVNAEDLYILRPQFAEQTVDIVEALLYTEDCGLIIIDSLAAMVTIRESEQSAEKSDVGGEAQAIKKLVKKAGLALNEGLKKNDLKALVCVNQTRSKIGVMFGSPETTPGGMTKNFYYSMRLRVYGSDVMDTKVSKMMPVRKKTIVTMIKWKCPIVNKASEFETVMIPHKGMKVGEANDWSLIQKYLEDYGEFGKAKNGKGYIMLGEEYPTIKAARNRVETDFEFGSKVKDMIIKAAVDEAKGDGINEDKGDD